MIDITLETKIADLLNAREDMKDILISINPKFKKLNNPILRRTLAKVASVKQAAIVGGMDAIELLNRLREAVGQEPIDLNGETIKTEQSSKKEPKWIKQKIAESFDANRLLDENKNPLAIVNSKLKQLNSGEIVTITADFKPEPLIEEFEKKGFETYTKELSENEFVTYIKKP